MPPLSSLPLLVLAALPPTADAAEPDPPRFRYDAASGGCIDAQGTPGRNPYDLKAIVTSGSAECVDLSGRDLGKEILALADADPAFDRSARFSKVSFRGADLGNTRFPAYAGPNRMTHLEGADIRGTTDAYGMAISGMIDAHTRFDDTCIREPEADGVQFISCPPPPAAPEPAATAPAP